MARNRRENPHPLVLVAVIVAWALSIFLYVFTHSGTVKASSVLFLSVVWIAVLFLIGTASTRIRPR